MATVEQGVNLLLQAALEYAGYGWRVVPLWHPVNGKCTCKNSDCETPGKHPRAGKKWQKQATTNLVQIESWWNHWPEANVGVQMGKESGIIDAETDGPDDEAALVTLFGGSPPPTCCFTGDRGKHWLYRFRDDFPAKGVHHFGPLGIRLGADQKGSQSVFPPSLHYHGKRYAWVIHPDDIPPAMFPDDALARIWNWEDSAIGQDGKEPRPAEHWARVLAGVAQGSRNEDMASFIGKLLFHVSDLGDQSAVQVLYESVRSVNERNNPPLKEEELRRTFVSILKREQNSRLSREVEGVLKRKPEDQIDRKQPPGQMRLIIVHSDPPRYKLFAPQFAKSEGGFLVLTAEQMVNGNAIKIQALKQAEYPLPGTFGKAWNAKDGLYERLIFNAEHEEAPLEERRHLVVAERLKGLLSKTRILEEGKPLDKRGRPTKLPDGSIVFLFTTVWEEMNMSADKVTRNELSAVLRKIEAGWYDKDAAKFKKLDSDSLWQLDALLASGTPTRTNEPI